MRPTPPRTPSSSRCRLVLLLTLHAGVLAATVAVLLDREIRRWGIESGESIIDVHRSVPFVAIIVVFGGLAVVAQVAWVVAHRSAGTWLAVAIPVTVGSAVVQAGWIAGILALRLSGDFSPVSAGAREAAAILVLEVVGAHVLVVLLLVAAVGLVRRADAATPAGP